MPSYYLHGIRIVLNDFALLLNVTLIVKLLRSLTLMTVRRRWISLREIFRFCAGSIEIFRDFLGKLFLLFWKNRCQIVSQYLEFEIAQLNRGFEPHV
jgi:hypothetical protein